jgi:hypothetical protein
MRRNKAFKRGRMIPILVAGGIGYLIGGWNGSVISNQEISASQAVALRFPEDWSQSSAVADQERAMQAPLVTGATDAHFIRTRSIVMDGAQSALFSPDPMVPKLVPQTATQTAALEEANPPSAPTAPAPTVTVPPRAAAAAANEARAAAIAARRRANRPGYLLNDTQIASIRERLNLTPDQARLWPAVEAALRNIAYARVHDEHRRGGAAEAQSAAVDPDSAEVQGLKSAATPLIMSFNTEQKEEVRNLVHVMGLDRLATQF